MSQTRKNIRCMWYNELGWPRVNPHLEKRGIKPPVGCSRDGKCYYSHPTDSTWETARNSDMPQHAYGNRPRPLTPVPPANRQQIRNSQAETARGRTPTGPSRVKDEQRSPRIAFGAESGSERDNERMAAGDRDARNGPSTSSRFSPNPSSSSSTKRARIFQDDYDHHEEDRQRRDGTLESQSSRSARRERSKDSSSHRKTDSLLSRMQMDDIEPVNQPKSPPPRGRLPFGPPHRDRAYDQSSERRTDREDSQRREHSFDHIREGVRPSTSPLRDTTPTWNSSNSTMHPPPPHTPMNGIALPPPPSFSQNSPVPRPASRSSFKAPRDVPSDKRRALWNERIHLLSEAVTARNGQRTASADLATLESLMDANRTSHFSLDVRDSMAKALEIAKANLEVAKKHQVDVVEKLFATDFWPMRTKREDGQVDDKLLADLDSKLDEMKAQVLALADEIAKNDRVLREVVEWIGSRAPDTDPIVNDVGVANRNLKRRKLDDEAYLDSQYVTGTTSTASSARVAPPPALEQLPTPVTTGCFGSKFESVEPKEVSSIIDRMKIMTRRVRELEGQFLTAREDSDEKIKEYVDFEVEEVKKNFVNKRGEHYTKRMLELKEDIETCGRDISFLSEELAEQIKLNVARNEELDHLRIEIQERSANIARLECELDKSRTELSEMRAECKQTTGDIKAISAAFKLLIGKTEQLSAPSLPSLEDLTAMLEPAIKSTIREEVFGMLGSFREELVQLVRERAVPFDPTFQEKLTKLALLPEALTYLHNNSVNGETGSLGAHGGPSSSPRPP